MKFNYTILFKNSPWENLKNKPNNNNYYNMLNNYKIKLNKLFNEFNYSINTIIIMLIIMITWLSSGIYIIKEGEEAVITRFGKFVRTGYPGLNYCLPSPLEKTFIEKVNKSRRIEIGYRSNHNYLLDLNNNKSINAESIMLTGDENIVTLNCDIIWHINNLKKFIFNIVNPEKCVKIVAESAIREIIGNTPISSILSDQKQEIANKVEILTQKILDQYQSGISIDTVQLLKAEPPSEVINSYRDVQTSKADKEREINQAQSYNNDLLPKTRGQADKILQEAQGYKQEIISKAQGDTKRFQAIYKQYLFNKDITKERLYLEAIENILINSNKIITNQNQTFHHIISKLQTQN